MQPARNHGSSGPRPPPEWDIGMPGNDSCHRVRRCCYSLLRRGQKRQTYASFEAVWHHSRIQLCKYRQSFRRRASKRCAQSSKGRSSPRKTSRKLARTHDWWNFLEDGWGSRTDCERVLNDASQPRQQAYRLRTCTTQDKQRREARKGGLTHPALSAITKRSLGWIADGSCLCSGVNDSNSFLFFLSDFSSGLSLFHGMDADHLPNAS